MRTESREIIESKNLGTNIWDQYVLRVCKAYQIRLFRKIQGYTHALEWEDPTDRRKVTANLQDLGKCVALTEEADGKDIPNSWFVFFKFMPFLGEQIRSKLPVDINILATKLGFGWGQILNWEKHDIHRSQFQIGVGQSFGNMQPLHPQLGRNLWWMGYREQRQLC
jgi:hypothetical protein